MPLKRTLQDLTAEVRPRIPEIDCVELESRLAADESGLLVIDVREDNERAAGFIAGSVHIGRGVLERDVEKRAFNGAVSDADLARPIVCYCRGGQRSLLTADSLMKMGFTNVISLRGGITEWIKRGKPIER